MVFVTHVVFDYHSDMLNRFWQLYSRYSCRSHHQKCDWKVATRSGQKKREGHSVRRCRRLFQTGGCLLISCGEMYACRTPFSKTTLTGSRTPWTSQFPVQEKHILLWKVSSIRTTRNTTKETKADVCVGFSAWGWNLRWLIWLNLKFMISSFELWSEWPDHWRAGLFLLFDQTNLRPGNYQKCMEPDGRQLVGFDNQNYPLRSFKDHDAGATLQGARVVFYWCQVKAFFEPKMFAWTCFSDFIRSPTNEKIRLASWFVQF